MVVAFASPAVTSGSGSTAGVIPGTDIKGDASGKYSGEITDKKAKGSAEGKAGATIDGDRYDASGKVEGEVDFETGKVNGKAVSKLEKNKQPVVESKVEVTDNKLSFSTRKYDGKDNSTSTSKSVDNDATGVAVSFVVSAMGCAALLL